MKKYIVLIEQFEDKSEQILKVIELGNLVFSYNKQYKVKTIYASRHKYMINDECSIVLSAQIYTIISNFSDENIPDESKKIKCVLVLARGRKHFDKKNVIKERDIKREMDRTLKKF